MLADYNVRKAADKAKLARYEVIMNHMTFKYGCRCVNPCAGCPWFIVCHFQDAGRCKQAMREYLRPLADEKKLYYRREEYSPLQVIISFEDCLRTYETFIPAPGNTSGAILDMRWVDDYDFAGEYNAMMHYGEPITKWAAPRIGPLEPAGEKEEMMSMG